MRERVSITLPRDLRQRVNSLADQRRLSRSSVVEAALESFLSPDGLDLREAAFTRRLDRLSRQASRIERDLRIANEALGLFVHFWLTVTPPVTGEGQEAARAQGRKRFDGYISMLGRRLQSGRSFAQEIADDVERLRDEQQADDAIMPESEPES